MHSSGGEGRAKDSALQPGCSPSLVSNETPGQSTGSAQLCFPYELSSNEPLHWLSAQEQSSPCHFSASQYPKIPHLAEK